MKYLGIGLLVYLLLSNREQEIETIDEFQLWDRTDVQKLKIRGKGDELYAYVEGRNVRAKIKNLDAFLNKLEELKGTILVEFDYESLEAQKESNLTPIINMALLIIIGYWIYLSYTFYKK